MTKRTKGILLAVAVLALSVVGGGSVFLYRSLVHSVAPVDGELALEGLEAPVQITFDSLGVPQIWAINETDAYFALGYQHAADRLFQMEIARRVSHGELSGLLGSLALEIDIRQRTVGHTQLAQAAVERLSEADRSRLASYVNGINRYLESARSLPFEFTLLTQTVEPWEIVDCLALLSFQTWFSDALQNRDEFFLRVAEKLGEEKARSLLLPYPYWAPYTVPPRKSLGARDSDSSPLREGVRRVEIGALSAPAGAQTIAAADVGARGRVAQAILANGGWGLSMATGSNGWVISPGKTASGKPILAGDPHLDVTRLPQFWYLAGLHIATDDRHVVGITTPGLPFFVMGTNGVAAWTMTAAGIDQTDYFAEEVNANDSGQYRTVDGWAEFATRVESLTVSDIDTPIVVTVRSTANGPVLIEDDSLNYVYALRWSGFDVDLSRAVGAGMALAGVTDFPTFRETVTSLGALNANWMYADTGGDIGYQLGAPIPVRPAGSHNLALRGWESDDSWRGYRELDETPWALNPEQGWLANCNNKQDQANLSYELQGAFFADRILRVSERLTAGSSFDVATTQALQLEWVDQYFLRWRDEIADLLDTLGETQRAMSLRSWSGDASRDSKETALIAEFIQQLRKVMFDDELGELSGQMKRLWVDQVYHSDQGFWFDDVTTDNVVETRDDVARRALANALTAVGDSAWGSIHTLSISHPFAFLPGIGGALGLQRGPYSRGGAGGTVNASYYQEVESGVYHTLAGPSWRFVIDLSDPLSTWMCAPAGNSGNPMSPHFFDFFPLWSEGRYELVPLDQRRAHERATSVLTLRPVIATELP
ncbi:MAG TPA: penicillin acylase family protein [candidate division Zixibacteria bacterium]|nr:penicillin acylase family protein [candidate division Zixibacteria bacterium]